MNGLEKPVKLGVYFHEKKGFAIAKKPDYSTADSWAEWEIDKNKIKTHRIFNIRVNQISEGTGSYFFWKHLKGYEYIGEYESFLDGEPQLNKE